MKLEKYLAIGEPIYKFECELKNGTIGTVDLFRQLDDMIDKPLTEKDKANYVYSIVKKIIDKLTDIAIVHAENKGINSIGLTGGVSYNIPISEMVEKNVRKK